MHVAILQQGSGGVGEVRSKAKSKAKARLRLKLRLKAKTNIDSHASPHGVGSADLCIWTCAPLWIYVQSRKQNAMVPFMKKFYIANSHKAFKINSHKALAKRKTSQGI